MHCDVRRNDFIKYVAAIRPRLRGQAFLLCGDWYEADDLVQDTLLTMYRRWPTLTSPNQSDGYTRRVLIRKFLSVRRRLRFRREVLHDDPPELPVMADDSVELRVPLLDCVRRLPPRQRAVIMLRFWEDCSIEQTATILGISAGTVASQTHKALATLRIDLDGQF